MENWEWQEPKMTPPQHPASQSENRDPGLPPVSLQPTGLQIFRRRRVVNPIRQIIHKHRRRRRIPLACRRVERDCLKPVKSTRQHRMHHRRRAEPRLRRVLHVRHKLKRGHQIRHHVRSWHRRRCGPLGVALDGHGAVCGQVVGAESLSVWGGGVLEGGAAEVEAEEVDAQDAGGGVDGGDGGGARGGGLAVAEGGSVGVGVGADVIAKAFGEVEGAGLEGGVEEAGVEAGEVGLAEGAGGRGFELGLRVRNGKMLWGWKTGGLTVAV